jgi:lipopolysaccharide/colanic/teichoic acid biosynthesis glycosyltransferase
MRKAQLDELPQLFNILKGDMSLIGPRPARPIEVDLADPAWQQVLSVQPGVSGLAQLVHEQGYVVSQRLRLDLQYIQHRSVRLDLRLLLQTVRMLLRQATSPV